MVAAARITDRAGSADDEAPRVVARGAKLREGVYVGLDWIRCVGPAALRWELTEWAKDQWGEGYAERPGVHAFAHALVWPNKARVQWGHDSDLCMVEIPGSVLGEMFDAEERVRVLRELVRMGLRATRLDVAIDFIGLDCHLYEKALASCHARELTGARRFKPTEEYGSGEVVGRTLYIGLRGNLGSGRMVRCYDKGLETGLSEQAGEWERWEAEFTGSKGGVAEQVVRAIVDAPDWTIAATKYALGAVDFQEVQKNRSTSGERARPRVQWWALLLAMIDTDKKRATRKAATLFTYAKHCERAVFPKLAYLSRISGESIDQVARRLIGELRVDPDKYLDDPVVKQYAEEFDITLPERQSTWKPVTA
jgi:DNA relaxase NicK